MEIERSCETAAHWTEQQYRDVFSDLASKPSRSVWVAERSGQGAGNVVGFLAAARLDYDWELENVVLSPAVRRFGIGKSLLEALLAEAASTQDASVFLEVRESNAPARALYEKAGFQIIGKRKSYYSNPLEDAILYRWRPR